MTEKELLEKKKEIERAKETLSELKGQESVLSKQLKTEWGCPSLDKAKEKIQEMKKEIDSMSMRIDEKSQELEEMFNNEESL